MPYGLSLAEPHFYHNNKDQATAAKLETYHFLMSNPLPEIKQGVATTNFFFPLHCCKKERSKKVKKNITS